MNSLKFLMNNNCYDVFEKFMKTCTEDAKFTFGILFNLFFFVLALYYMFFYDENKLNTRKTICRENAKTSAEIYFCGDDQKKLELNKIGNTLSEEPPFCFDHS